MSSPRLRSLAAVFLRYGNMTFGGGSATIGTLHLEIITKRSWVTQQQFDLSYALSRLTPGTNLLAFSTAIGWLVSGWEGALVVLLASSIPCRAVLTYVETGNVDAGFVYRTDAMASTKVRVVAAAPTNSHDPIVYPAAVLKNSKNVAEARAFLEFCGSPEASAVFSKYGFTSPEKTTEKNRPPTIQSPWISHRRCLSAKVAKTPKNWHF